MANNSKTMQNEKYALISSKSRTFCHGEVAGTREAATRVVERPRDDPEVQAHARTLRPVRQREMQAAAAVEARRAGKRVEILPPGRTLDPERGGRIHGRERHPEVEGPGRQIVHPVDVRPYGGDLLRRRLHP